jgi:hypothetical protein
MVEERVPSQQSENSGAEERDTQDHALGLFAATQEPPLNRSRSTSAERSWSPELKKFKRNFAVNNTETLWFIFLILSGLSPDKQLYPPDRHLAMNGNSVRTLFDPMVGEFCADTSPKVLDAFFNSKMR